MFKEVLRSMEGIGIFPIISLILFFTFFVIMVVYLIIKGKKHYEDAARLPLNNDEYKIEESEL